MTFKDPPAFLLRVLSQKNLILSVVFLVLLISFIATYLVVSARRERQGKLFAFNPEKIAVLTLSAGTATTVIKKQADGFVFAAPYPGKPADPKKVRAYCEAISKLSIIRDVGVYDAKNAAQFGISPESPGIIVEAGNVKTHLILGKNNPVARQWYVYDPRSRRILLTDIAAYPLITFQPENFRDNQLLVFSPADAENIDIVRRGSGRLAFKKENDMWFVQDYTANRVYPCDTKPVLALTADIARLSISDFLPADSSATLRHCGLDAPRATIAVTVSSGVVHEAGLGNVYGDGKMYASRGGAVAGGVSAGFMERLSVPTTSYFRTTLIDFPVARIAAITCATADDTIRYDKHRGRWYRTAKKKRPYDQDKMDAFLFYMGNLTAETFLKEDSLGAVISEYIFFSRTGEQLLRLEVGGQSGAFTKVRLNKTGTIIGVSSELLKLMVL